MPVYTVHGRKNADPAASDAGENLVFVRDGFHFWAFLVPFLWLLWHRLWLAFIGFVAVSVALQFGLSAINASSMVQLAAMFLLSLLMGFEGASLRRWSLSHWRWKQFGLVVANNVEEAEQRYFSDLHRQAADHHAGNAPARSSVNPQFPTANVNPDPGIVGLFPQPGASR